MPASAGGARVAQTVDQRRDIDASEHDGQIHHGPERRVVLNARARDDDHRLQDQGDADRHEDPPPEPAAPVAAREQRDKGDHRVDHREKRLAQLVMGLRDEAPPAVAPVGQHVLARVQKIADRVFLGSLPARFVVAHELAQVVDELLERDRTQALPVRGERERDPVAHHQPRLVAVAQQHGDLGRIGHRPGPVALVVQEDAAHLPGPVGFADEQGQPRHRVQELPLDDQRIGEIGADRLRALGKRRAAARNERHQDNGHGQRDQPPEHRDRAQERRRAETGRHHHHEFTVGIELVEGIERRPDARQRQHDHEDLRQHQRGKLEEHRRTLAARDHRVDEPHRLRQPDYPGEDQHEEAEGGDKLAQDVSVQSCHRGLLRASGMAKPATSR
jgi:hypothetical protein